LKPMNLQSTKECWVCGKRNGLHHHEVFFGPYRQKSIEYGMQVWLCPAHHNMSSQGVHMNRELDLKLKRYAQSVFEGEYGHDAYMETFKRNYL